MNLCRNDVKNWDSVYGLEMYKVYWFECYRMNEDGCFEKKI
jgi:hypothetical protein